MPGQNVYPSPDNYPVSSFRSPVPPPDVDPDEGDLLLVAYNPAWQEVLLGACMQLLNPATWEGTDAEKILAMNRAETLRYMLTVQLQNEAPYWDDEDGGDAGNEDNPEDFPWYENISDFIVTSFLSTGITPGAAIQFVGTARKFRLAWRRSGFGGIVRVFLDGVGIADVDTYSPVEDLTFLDVFTEPAVSGFSAFAADPWELRIVNTGTANPLSTPVGGGYRMDTIRKRLWSDEVSPDNLRYNEETDTVEETFDGGETWVERPLFDPRHAPQFRFPSIDASDPRCQAAANMTEWIEVFIEEVLYVLAVGGVVISLVTLMVALFLVLGPWAVVIGVFFPIAQLIYDAGSTAVSGAMTPAMFNTLECILYCAIGEDGQVTAGQLADINTEIDAQIGGLAAAILHVMFLAMGEVGLSNAGTIGEAAADCSECNCGCTYRWDFREDDGGWFSVNYGSPYYSAWSWTSGQGWIQGGDRAEAWLKSPAIPEGTVITEVRLNVTIVGATVGDLVTLNGYNSIVYTTDTNATITLPNGGTAVGAQNFLQQTSSHSFAATFILHWLEVDWDYCP